MRRSRPRPPIPRGDIWWGGTGDPHMQAAEEGLTVEYKSPKLRRAAGLGGAAMGAVEEPHRRHLFRRARLRLQHRAAEGEGHRRAEMLGRPARVRSSRTRSRSPIRTRPAPPTRMLATIVQIMGEDKGFDYLKALHKNVNQYTKSGAAPAKAAGLGETTVGIAFLHDMVTMVVDKRADQGRSRPAKAPATRSARCRSSRARSNLDNAKKWYDWALTPAAQKLGAEAKSYQVPSNKSDAGAAAGAEARRDQADRLRLREIRLVRRAQAAAREVGQRGEEPAEIGHAGASATAHCAAVASGRFDLDRARLGIGYAHPALVSGRVRLGLPGRRCARAALRARRFDRSRWLLPMLAPLLLAAAAAGRAASRRCARPRWLVAAGAAGLALHPPAGLRHRALTAGRWSLLAALFGAPGPRQAGMGYGAALTAAAFLILLCHGLAARGWCRGDAFVVVLDRRRHRADRDLRLLPRRRPSWSARSQDNAGHFAPAEFVDQVRRPLDLGPRLPDVGAALRRRLEHALPRPSRRLRHDRARPCLRAHRDAHRLSLQEARCAS